MEKRKVGKFAMWTHLRWGYSWERQIQLEKAEVESKKALLTTCAIGSIGLVGGSSSLQVHAEDYAKSMISAQAIVESEVEVEILTETEGDAIPEQLEGAEGTGGLEGAEGTGEAEGAEGTRELEGAEGTGEAEGAEGTGGLEGTEGTGGLEGTEGTRELEGAEGTGEAEGAEGAGGSEGTGGLEGTEGTVSGNDIFTEEPPTEWEIVIPETPTDEADMITAGAGFEEAEVIVAQEATMVMTSTESAFVKTTIVEKGVTLTYYEVDENFILSHGVPTGDIMLTEQEFTNFCKEMEAEAGGEGLTGKVIVGNVILNRMRRDGASLNDVIFAQNQFASIAGVENVSKETIEAARMALESDYTVAVMQAVAELEGLSPEEYSQGSFYFYNPAGCNVGPLNVRKDIQVAARYKGHVFTRDYR